MASRPSKKLGLLLSTAPENPNLETVVRLSTAALEQNHQVYLYLIDEGTLAMGDPRLDQLIGEGLKLFVCAYGAEKHRTPLHGKATPCGLVVLSDLIKACDPFLSFN
ncbi:MAG TPA: DsrE family protein [Nitrospiria bacterium]|nr:DsrE family protein [Nitrospiria bacterium]